MFLLGPTVVYSASDLTAAATCEWATMHRVGAKLGRVELSKFEADDMLARTAKLGDAHELRVLADLKATRDVVEIARPENPTEVEEVARQTSVAFQSEAGVVYQADFFDGRFSGTPTSSCDRMTAATRSTTPSSPGTRRSPRCCSSRRTASNCNASASAPASGCTCGSATCR
ncbi:hypothetical protein [Lacisediminihabitans changchengi]|uniref:Uncharacterized protein n=1 Tax=Lacisediminihabitans changchengi TaxID=2787634 RepID=A0A934W436_9MICO|nr:hypothetical protein [Lacisediminihabitans changchengi]MBK4347100.1 hypothetical protein [Lacisediminihabitans changchengi]